MKKKGLTFKVITALILGAVVGLLLNLFAPNVFDIVNPYLFVPLGKIFLALINMLVVPLVFLSLVLGIAGLGDPVKLGRIGIKTITYFLVTTTIAILIGLTLAAVIQPGLAGDFDLEGASFEAEKAPSIAETLMNVIPQNPLAAMTEGNMLQIIVFAAFVGLAMVLGSVGLPVEGIGLVIGIDRLLDMSRTAVNISGDAACALYVAESEKKRELKLEKADRELETN